MDQIKYNPKHCAKRWLGYFDLLGTTELTSSGAHLSIFEIYRKAMEEVKRRKETLPSIEHVWFSDTVIFYSEDKSLFPSWGELDHITRWFLYFLIEKHIPARGAVSLGEFYADKENSLFFGKALIEAYKYGEAQNWIGLLVCPSAEKELKRQGQFTGTDLNYAYTTIPWGKGKEQVVDTLPACILGKWTIEAYRENPSLKSLNEMRSRLRDEKHTVKYDNAIEFIRAHMCSRS